MATLALIRKSLYDIRLVATAMALVCALMAFVIVLIYPQYHEQFKDLQLPEAFRGFLGEAQEWGSPAGFLAAEYFSWIPLLLITVAIVGGSGATAGEEGAGTLDVLLAQPVGRVRLLLAKAAGLTLALVLIVLLSLPGFFVGKLFADLPVSNTRIVLANLNMLPLALLFLALSLLAGAVLPSRAAAAGAVTGLLIAAYFLTTIGAAVDALHEARQLSPFYWADASRVLVHGFHEETRWLGFLALTGVLLAAAAWAFQRRDIAAGKRETDLGGWLARLRGRSTEATTGEPLARAR